MEIGIKGGLGSSGNMRRSPEDCLLSRYREGKNPGRDERVVGWGATSDICQWDDKMYTVFGILGDWQSVTGTSGDRDDGEKRAAGIVR